MNLRHCVLVVALPGVLTLPACQAREAAPADVRAAYSNLLASLDPETPGFSLLRLKAFARRHARYDVASVAEQDAAVWRDRLQPAYLRARDLVREGRFETAEAMLKDLALVPDEPAGEQAVAFLAFDFHQVKASRLLVMGDSAGAEAAARGLLGKVRGDDQMTAAQQLLDAAAMATLGARMTRTTALQSAARTLQVFLHSYYADNGRYPERLSLDDPALL